LLTAVSIYHCQGRRLPTLVQIGYLSCDLPLAGDFRWGHFYAFCQGILSSWVYKSICHFSPPMAGKNKKFP